jgi:hypothetical protein
MSNHVSGPRIPGSEGIPFSPINPWGREPVVKRRDGTVINWKSPLREPIFQVFVEDAEQGLIPIGPKCPMGMADNFLAATKLAIRSGRISGWTNPHLVKAPPERAAARVF